MDESVANDQSTVVIVSNEPKTSDDLLSIRSHESTANGSSFMGRIVELSVKTLRRILSFKETIHKYGVFVPRNDREADASPEAVRWASGRQLE